MPKKSESKKMESRVWIELEHPQSAGDGHVRASLMTIMLRRLGVAHQRVWWSVHEGRYCYGDDMGYIVLSDTGHWFNLEHFGRELTPIDAATAENISERLEDAQNFATLQAKMVDCGWGDNPDGTVTHEHLGMQHPSWVDAISACIEVASEA